MRRLFPLVVSGAVLVAACDDDDPITPSGSLALSIGQSAATVLPGTSASLPMTITRSGSFAGSVTLTAEDLPAGVSATFEPETVTGTGTYSVLTLTGASGATAGSGTVSIRGSGSGVNAATATLPVTVAVTGATMRAVPASVSTPQGTSITIPIVIERIGTFTGDLTLNAPGLPTGITAAFSPGSITSGTRVATLTVTPSTTAPVGSIPIMMTGVGSGIGTHVQTVAITITSATIAGFSMFATPAAVTVQAGLAVTSVVTASRHGGFAGAIQLTASGAPTGMTVSVAPLPSITGTTATLTITTTAGTTPGVYPLVLTGTATGATNATAYVTVVVTAPPS